MSYKKSVYIKAKEILAQRKATAEREAEMRRSAAVVLCPEILEVEKEMASHGIGVVKAIGMGANLDEYMKNLAVANLKAQARRKELLKNAGFPEDYLDIKYTCDICKDTGYNQEFYCQCYRKLIRDVARENLGVNSPLKKCTFDTFRVDRYPDIMDSSMQVNQREHMKSVYQYCKDYAENFTADSIGLFMYGKTGLGKTHLSLAIANEVINRGYDVYYGSVQSIMDKLEAEHFGRLPREDSIKDDILDCDLLIIDDLGTEFSTQFTNAELYNIINSRILASLPTIISTNLSIEEIGERYTQRVASRIIGSSMAIYFCGKDIRQMD
jgi:DNA replication protein DnaC